MESRLVEFPAVDETNAESSTMDMCEIRPEGMSAAEFGELVSEGNRNCKRKYVGDPCCCGCRCDCRSDVRKNLSRDINCGGNSLQIISSGERVKKTRKVVQMRQDNRKRQPNINCRVEAFGRVICEFDEVRKRWVVEMGFGGLLSIVRLTLPRMLCYWLMTRLDPVNESIRLGDGQEIILTPNHVRWVLGLPNGGKELPRKVVLEEKRTKVESFREKYGFDCLGTFKKTGREICSKGLAITDEIIDRLKGEWKNEDEEEFKMLFLLLSLYMILCPTQSRCLEGDLVPSLTCAMDASSYDWCGLVLQKLMGSVRRFAKKFDANGYAGGCGGCSIFVAIFYLDRLHRKPINWFVWPRVQVWTAAELRRASQEDRFVPGGDFGKLQSLNASYGELHPLDGGDKTAPDGDCGDSVACFMTKTEAGFRRTRGRKALGKAESSVMAHSSKD